MTDSPSPSQESTGMAPMLILMAIVTVVFICLFMFSGKTDSSEVSNRKSLPTNPRALKIVQQSQCFLCHKITLSSTEGMPVGPAYTQIAARYRDHPNPEEVLAILKASVRKGSQGKYGGNVMTENPVDKISDEDLDYLLKWISGL